MGQCQRQINKLKRLVLVGMPNMFILPRPSNIVANHYIKAFTLTFSDTLNKVRVYNIYIVLCCTSLCLLTHCMLKPRV